MYIGKAANLRNRVKQYLKVEFYAPFLSHLIKEAEKVEYKTTDSEIEALLLESKLIKKHQPKYNIMLRDDKQYFYVGFTKEEFPKILLTHQTESPKFKIENYIGPFTDGTALKSTLRLLRRIFPYCTCKQKHNNFCLNYHIGKCLGFCCLKKPKIIKKEHEKYRRNIKAIKDILSGKKDTLVKKLKKELKDLGKQMVEFVPISASGNRGSSISNKIKDFDEIGKEAIELRNKIERLERVFENAKIIQDTIYQLGTKTGGSLETLKNIFKLPKIPYRIEGYDVSNIQGKNATGAMVVFTNGIPDKNEYRKFKIRFKKTPDDIAMLKEVLKRRFNHPEWPQPDLIFVDGGKAQLNAVLKIMSLPSFAAYSAEAASATKAGKATEGTAVISLAKGKNEIFSSTLKKPVSMKKLPNEVRNLIKLIDAEAHRFAVSYYRSLHRRKTLQ